MFFKRGLIIIGFLSFVCQGVFSNDMKTLLRTVEDSIFYYPELAKERLLSLLSINEDELSAADQAYVNYLNGVLLFNESKIDSSFVDLQKATDYFILQNDKSGLSKCQFMLGNIADLMNQFEQAKINYFECISNSDEDSYALRGLANLGLARCYRRLGEEYEDYFNKGSGLVSRYGSKEQKLYLKYLIVFIADNSTQTKIDKLIEVSDSFKMLGLERRYFGALNLVSKNYRALQMYDSAHFYADLVLEYFDENNLKDASVEPSATLNKALIFYQQEDFVNSEIWLNKSLKTYEKYGVIERQYYSYNIFYNIDVIRGDYKSAFEHLKLAFDRKEQTNSITKQRVAKLAEISSDISALKQSLQKLRWDRLVVIIISSFSIVIALLMLYIVIRKKNQRQKEILLRNNELEKIAINTQEKLRLLKKQGVDEIASGAVTHKSLIDDLEFAYGETYNILKQEFTILSKTELRYALMFVLDYSNDVICSILSVQVAAVRKAKQRIKQKLELQSDASVEEIFKSAVKKGMSS